MASGGSFGGARGLQPVTPKKGVFPLDQFPTMQGSVFFSLIFITMFLFLYYFCSGSRFLQLMFSNVHSHQAQAMKDYMSCLEQNKLEVEKCRNLSRRYLECHMEK